MDVLRIKNALFHLTGASALISEINQSRSTNLLELAFKSCCDINELLFALDALVTLEDFTHCEDILHNS